MKPRLVLLLVLIGVQVSTSQVFEGRKAFRLKPATNELAPRIDILEPPLGNQKQWITTNRNLPLKGLVQHEKGIRMVEVNNVEARVELNGYFESVLELTEGVNPISITARSNVGSQATMYLKIIFDNAPPIVEVLEPRPTGQRGIRNVDNEVVLLKVRAADASGIRSVLANGQQMKLVSDSIYTIELTVPDAEKEISIVATDGGGTKREQVISVRRSSVSDNLELLKGKAYALIIGIDKYKGDVWAPLDNAVRDARAVEEVFRNNFVFEGVTTLYDHEATKAGILEALTSYTRVLKPEDRLLVYYSGHGDLNPQFNRGYWVPVDATSRSITGYISNSEMRDYLGLMPANQVLLVADACFAGDIVERGANETLPFQDSPEYFKQVAQKRSRRALTSGSNEPVADSGSQGHSWFAYWFLDALGKIEGKYFDAHQVYNWVREPVSSETRQFPRFERIEGFGDAGGQFVFIRK